MKELKKQVEILTNEELERANKKFMSKFNSTHEAYAVLKEEVEEAQEEFEYMNHELNCIWDYVKRNKTENALAHMKNMKKYAINMAAEAVQVGAMCEKFIDSFEK